MATNTSRRNLLKSAGLGGVAAGLGLTAYLAPSGSSEAQAAVQAGHQNHGQASGPLAQATVTFGAWQADQGWDRMDPAFDPITANHHTVAPFEVQIRAGGSVSYAVSGFHQILVYDDGVQPSQIDTSNLIISPGPIGPPFPILIDDPANRIYRGLNPGEQTLDRIESVQFSEPGRYLVICGVVFHFVNDSMYGYVKVLP